MSIISRMNLGGEFVSLIEKNQGPNQELRSRFTGNIGAPGSGETCPGTFFADELYTGLLLSTLEAPWRRANEIRGLY
jgi:hypothetical protein